MSNATLRHLHVGDISTFSWESFVLQESLIRYFLPCIAFQLCENLTFKHRTFIYIFLLDSAFVIFNNSPPRLVVPELKMDLACPEPCFQATSSEECFIQLHSWNAVRASGQRLDVSLAVEIICQGQISDEDQAVFSALSILNMFTIVTGKGNPASPNALLICSPKHQAKADQY